MKTTPLVAISLLGWYLMAPPGLSSTPGADANRPLSEWRTLQPFDSARDCKRWLAEYEAASTGDELREAMSFRCVASDDPRLSGK